MPQIALNDLARHTAAQHGVVMQAITRVLDRGWFVLGPEVVAFESEFARYCGARHAVGVANGTDAIELALRALGVGAGDEVIVAANAGMYSASALRAIGAAPVYADVESRHLNLDPVCAAAAITPRTRAMIATHLYGRMADVTALRALCDDRGIALMEDCAQAHGAMHGGVRAGAWGDAAAFSFYPTKNLGALGDAGLVACRDEKIAARLRRLRQYGWDTKYHAVEGPARNSRLDEIQAAVLRAKLPGLDGWNSRRRAIAAQYSLIRHAAIVHPDVAGSEYVAHLYVLRTPARDQLRAHLSARDVATEIHYPLLDPDQPALAGHTFAADLPVSRRASGEILSLPCYPEMEATEVRHVCAALADWSGA